VLKVLYFGLITDGHGRTVDFRNTVVVMTSNLGSSRIQELAFEGYDAMKAAVMDVVGQHFRPEFINRVDEMVVFHPLDREQIKLIAGIQLGHLRKRMEASNFGMEVSDEALELLAEAGFDPVYGARPLKRAIQNEIENPLAQKILSGDLTPGKTIRIDVKEGRFIFV
jgi:ATP-dependent Clp protease ATP-binding subunit ClpB